MVGLAVVYVGTGATTGFGLPLYDRHSSSACCCAARAASMDRDDCTLYVRGRGGRREEGGGETR